nr:autotransporter-associated N-terminal domain-containing protein [Leptotrichia sp. oral taxon 498]
MTNNLKVLKKELKAFAKRVKDFKYTDSALIVFLLTGMIGIGGISFNLYSAEDEIKTQEHAINTSILQLQKDFKRARQENNRLLRTTNLELIQLMEQGDHVVKSPWSSWQYGMNYVYNDWQGTYKGRGDKKAKYPYEGVYQRSLDIYERSVSPDSDKYGLLSRNRRPNFALGSAAGYGIGSFKPVKEPIVPFEVNAGIRPRSINKSAIRIADKTAVTPTLPEAISFTPPKPVIGIPKDPFTPNPPTFAVILGADYNENGNSSSATPRQNTRGGFLGSGDNTSSQNIDTILHYTWPYNNLAEMSYAFKMYKETNTTTLPALLTGNTYYFNSYNFGGIKEFGGGVASSQGTDRNHQYFFIGGSRFWEIDNYSGTGTFEIPNGKTVSLGGILTLAMVSQENGATLKNSGTITDVDEKNDGYIVNMNYDAGKNYKLIYGPNNSQYYVKKVEMVMLDIKLE